MRSSQNLYAPVPQSISDSDSEKDQNLNDPPYINNKINHSTQKEPISKSKFLKTSRRRSTGMSPLRKFCFVLSHIVCFGTIFVFLFLIPCDGDKVCPVRISNWEIKHKGFELKGAINVVKDVLNYSTNLALLFTQNFLNFNSHSGVIGLLSNNGLIAWYMERNNGPIDMNCYLIDVNIDGTTDCLLVKTAGIEAIDPISGEILWSIIHSREASMASFPLILPDLNKDGVKEVLISNHNELLLTNGATGNVLCRHVFSRCVEVKLHAFHKDHIACACVEANRLSHFKIPISEFRKLMQNTTYDIKTIKLDYSLPEENTYKINNHQLLVNSTGDCPKCESTVTLLNTEIGRIVYFKRFPKTDIMQPSYFTFEKTPKNEASLQNHLNGFILKLWQFNEKSNAEFIGILNMTVKINIIKERILLLTFNSTNIQVINASFTEIIQLCIPSDGENYDCQPNSSNQNKSLLITDIDNDEKLELISYSSTFVPEMKASGKTWELVSNVKVFHLEAELPKFYRVN